MSFESGKTTGLIASLIAVVVPVAAFALSGLLILSIISSILTAATSSSHTVVPSALTSAALIPFLLDGLALIALVGFILFVYSMHSLSHYYNEQGIFRDVIYGVVIAVAGIGILVVLEIVSLFSQRTISTGTSVSIIFPFIFLILGAVVVEIVAAVFFMQAFNKLSQKSNVDSFHTAGILLLVGAITSFIGIGGIIAWLAWIFAASGFHSLKPNANPAAPSYPQYNSPPSALGTLPLSKYCQYCGAQITSDALYCPNCGRQVPQ